MSKATVSSATAPPGTTPMASSGERAASHSEIASIQERPQPIVPRKGPSNPKGMATAANTPDHITRVMMGVTARLANRLSGEIR